MRWKMDRLESAVAGFVHAGYRFDGFRLEADGTLYYGEIRIHLSTKELAALRLLLANPGMVVTPPDLKQALWGNTPVMSDAVSRCLASLRNKLDPLKCIETVNKRGYRLSVAVEPLYESSGALPLLAILPFTTGHGVPEYLGAVIAEEAGARLGNARQPVASILARDSVFALAHRELSPLQIGRMLHADLVLSGTLRALPEHYRMRAEMTRIADGSQAWVEDLLVERNRIAGPEIALAGIVTHRVGAGQLSTAASAAADPEHWSEREQSAQRLDAYELFQRARYEWQSLERHRMQDAQRHLERAAELDASLIEARLDLVHLSVTQEIFGFMAPSIAADLARRTAGSIPEFTIGADRILPSLGWLAFHVDRNLTAAQPLFRRSAHVPHDAWVTCARAQFALGRHRFEEAADVLRAAIRIDPYSPLLQGRLAWVLHLAGHAEASVDLIRKALELSSENESAELYGINIFGFNGDVARAMELAQNLTRRLPYFDLATTAHAYALAVAGRSDEARAVLDRLQWLSRERYVLSTISAFAHMALGEEELAMIELQAANERRCPWFFQVLADPRLKPLHNRPEFGAMLQIIADMEAQAARER